jgi:hypothetical protein
MSAVLSRLVLVVPDRDYNRDQSRDQETLHVHGFPLHRIELGWRHYSAFPKTQLHSTDDDTGKEESVGWVKVKWIPLLFAAFDALWPNRTRTQDGTIGDTAHQASKSGHNPDDTPGSLAERTDADNIAEVRAADVDARGVNMQAVIDAIVADPDERKRFIYIIFNGYIWSASNGWRKVRYTGSDQHTTHAHFSGDPNYDEDARPFAFSKGDDMSTHSDAVIEAWRTGMPTAADGSGVEPVKWRIADEGWQRRTDAALKAQAEQIGNLTAALTAQNTALNAILAKVETLSANGSPDGTYTVTLTKVQA